MKRDIIRKLVESQPGILKKHGDPMSRRDLIGAGYIATGGLVMMPHMAKLIGGEQAFADEACAATGSTGDRNQSAVICLDLGGGCTMPFNFPPMGADGSPMPSGSYNTIGMSTEFDPNNVELDTTFGIPMNPNSRMLQGMKDVVGINAAAAAVAVEAEEFASRVNGYITCVTGNDDSQNNEHNSLMGVAKLGYKRLITSIGDSDNANGSGGRSAPVADWFDATQIPVTINRKEDAINIVLPPVLKDYLPDTAYANVTDMISKWSLSDQAYFMSRNDAEQTEIVKKLADKKCAYESSGTLVSKYTPAEVDIDQDAIQGFQDLWNNDQGSGSIVKLLCDDIATGGVLTMGGFDYHGNGAQTQNNRDLGAGEMLGRLIRSFCLKKKNAMISLYTDGGTSSNGNTPVNGEQRIEATGDSGQRQMRVTFFINGAGTGTATATPPADKLVDTAGYKAYQAALKAVHQPKMTQSLKQFGAYNTNGAVDRDADTLISTSPAKACGVDLLNLLKFDGNMDLAGNLDLPDAAKYGIMVETKPS